MKLPCTNITIECRKKLLLIVLLHKSVQAYNWLYIHVRIWYIHSKRESGSIVHRMLRQERQKAQQIRYNKQT